MPFTSETARKAGKKSSREGVPNRDTSIIRDKMVLCLTEEDFDLVKWLKEVASQDPKEALKIFASLAEYAIPKLSRTEFSGDIKTEDGIDYSQLSDEALKEIANAKSKS